MIHLVSKPSYKDFAGKNGSWGNLRLRCTLGGARMSSPTGNHGTASRIAGTGDSTCSSTDEPTFCVDPQAIGPVGLAFSP